jgi:hypothetical protein
MALDKKSITDELEALQLEETRERVEEMRNNRAARHLRAERRNVDLLDARARQEAIQANCWHKKGGKGVQQLAHGNDHNYAVIKHTLSHGPMIVLCQRCSKVWEPPDTALNARKASVEDKALYRKLYEEYQWAVNLPTDNEPSGTQLFVITKAEPAA